MSIQLPSRRLVSQNDASMIESAQVPRSRFSGSWTRKTTFDAGFLVPFLVDEILPGDHMSYDVTAYLRLATPLFPLFDNQRVDTFFFFVPNRILWDQWTRFMGEQSTPAESTDVQPPVLNVGGASVGSLYDHMGLPLSSQVSEPIPVNALPFRAYNKIWNQWFRDQNLQDSISEVSATTGSYILRRRAKSHDYFTSALPWPQKFTAPAIPVGGLAPVLGLGIENANSTAGAAREVWETGNPSKVSYSAFKQMNESGIDDRVLFKLQGGAPQIYADLTEASGVHINTLRQAWLVQSLLERDARGGTRYVELVRSHFGVVNPDFRIQRPEYIGGGQTSLSVTPIAQTAPTEGAPVGALGAAGTAAGSHRASYAATEHGFIIGLINVRSELSYQQGLHKMWSRRTRYDYYWPSLAGLGEQAVLRKEIYATGVEANDEAVFGYQERWHEYRTRQSEVTGQFRSQAAGTLDAWHLSQFFDPAPTLNAAFIEDNPPMSRVLAAGELAAGQQYLADILIQRTAVRPIPMYGTPVTLGRF